MNKRYITIVLSFLIGVSGVFAHPAFAADCAAHATCAPVRDVGRSAGGNSRHCACTLWHSQPAAPSCRLTSLLQTSRQRFLNPTFKHIQLSGLGLSGRCLDRVPTMNRLGPIHRLNSTDSPLSLPIYLQTLALLC